MEEDKALATSDYWDSRYEGVEGDGLLHEWLRSFDELVPFFESNLFSAQGRKPEDNPFILHLGSGDSSVPVDLAQRGYKRHLCVDFSKIIVERMKERHAGIDGIEWRFMDVRDMADVGDETVDVAFDKSTLDAMVHGSPWNPPDEVIQNTSRYMKEVHRVLKNQGVFLCISYRQPHFMRRLLDADRIWDIDVQVLGDEASFNYYGFVITKKTAT